MSFAPISKELALAGTEVPPHEATRDGGEGRPVAGALATPLDPPWIKRLFQQHGERMKSIACNLLGSTADAEDAVQETFLKVFRGAGGFRGGAAVTTWVYRILVNTCHDQRRRTRRRSEAALSDESAAGGGGGGDVPDDIAAGRAPGCDHPLRLAIEAELRRLPAQERAAFLLCEVEGFSHREAGEILDVPEATSRTFLFRAKRRLQQALRAEEGQR